MKVTPLYLDHHSTTPLDPRVLEVMLPYFTEKFGNAASRSHAFGWEAERAVARARASLARVIHARPEEIIFTSGATEANNLALFGMLETSSSHLITCSTEHASVLDVCKVLESRGMDVTYLPVDATGLLDPNQVEKAITPRTALISIMSANNEIGVLQPVGEIGKIARKYQIPFHTDAAQALGKIPLDVEMLAIDLMSISAHKIYGPKGIGALYVRKIPKINLRPQIYGGGHERGLRSGTLNVPGIVGLGRAVEIAAEEMTEEQTRLRKLRDEFYTNLSTHLDEIVLNGHPEKRLAQNLNLSFLGVDANALMMDLKQIAVSSGSACSSASPKPSHVLKALGLSEDRIRSAIRFGLGRQTTREELSGAAEKIISSVKRLRG